MHVMHNYDDGPAYLTKGKIYEVLVIDGCDPTILDDEGGRRILHLPACAYLGGRPWTVLEDEARKMLVAARARIADPEHWTQGVYARDPEGMEVDLEVLRACQFCSLGALYKEGLSRPASWGTPAQYSAKRALNSAAGVLGYTTVPGLNDEGGHGLVMQMFDAAIGSLERPA